MKLQLLLPLDLAEIDQNQNLRDKRNRSNVTFQDFY
jgi:hypothetical protein